MNSEEECEIEGDKGRWSEMRWREMRRRKKEEIHTNEAKERARVKDRETVTEHKEFSVSQED